MMSEMKNISSVPEHRSLTNESTYCEGQNFINYDAFVVYTMS